MSTAQAKPSLKSLSWVDCPHCKFDRGIGGERILADYCLLHEEIARLGEELSFERQTSSSVLRILDEVTDILGGSPEDNPVDVAKGRMDEIFEMDAALFQASREASGNP